MVPAGKRAAVLGHLLREAGLQPAPAASGPPRLTDFVAAHSDELLDLYRRLGGVQEAPTLRPGPWDLPFGEVAVVELDEELHFNRYRALTLSASWAARLPWTDDYLRYCNEHEKACLSAGRWGKRWTNLSSERMFGAAGPPGQLGGAGAPRWKQRALYDAMKDLAAAAGLGVRLARVAVHDSVDDHRMWDVLDGYAALQSEAIRNFVEGRIA